MIELFTTESLATQDKAGRAKVGAQGNAAPRYVAIEARATGSGRAHDKGLSAQQRNSVAIEISLLRQTGIEAKKEKKMTPRI